MKEWPWKTTLSILLLSAGVSMGQGVILTNTLLYPAGVVAGTNEYGTPSYTLTELEVQEDFVTVSYADDLTGEFRDLGTTSAITVKTDRGYFTHSVSNTIFDVYEEAKAGALEYYNGEVELNLDCVTESGRQATLVSPTVAIGCQHWTYHVGEEIYFAGQTAIVSRVENGGYDIAWFELDRPINVETAILAPEQYYLYMGLFEEGVNEWSAWGTGLSFRVSVPDYYYAVSVNQNKKVDIVALDSIYMSEYAGYHHFYVSGYDLMPDGDSGSPLFLVIRGKLILFGIITQANQAGYIPYQTLIDGVSRGL